jgi:hypothetical protein
MLTLHTGAVTKLVSSWTSSSMLWLESAGLQLDVCRMCAGYVQHAYSLHWASHQAGEELD